MLPLPESEEQSGARAEGKGKEQQVVGEGDDAIIIEHTSSDDDDEEKLE
jgi:hypothetical protein